MKKNLLFVMVCFFTAFSPAQFGATAVPQFPPTKSAIVFRYDDAGNQVLRGYDCNNCPVPLESEMEPSGEDRIASNASADEAFWNEVNIYPVPVRDIMTVVWSAEVNDLISDVSLYEHNTVHWKFQQVNLPNLNRQIKIDMTRYYMGVYVLVFQLRDGRMVSKNITKF